MTQHLKNVSNQNNLEENRLAKNNVESYLLEVASGRRGVVPSLLRGGLGLLAPIYCAGLKGYLLPYHLGWRKRTRLGCPVLCVGNLTTGGTGKTPMTQTLCRLLQEQGKKVVILSRGYGGANEYGCAVVSDYKRVHLNVLEAGDEAFLLAMSLPGVPVMVGKDRRVTGKIAIQRFQPDVILLDDGMQFWQLHRDLDIVLLNASRPFDNGWTFPRGLLREPPSHLKRAGVIVLTNARRVSASQLAALQQRAASLAPRSALFTADLNPLALRPLNSNSDEKPHASEQNQLQPTQSENNTLAVTWLEGKRIAALSALGNPQSFEEMLTSLGATLVARFRFRDHQQITGVLLGEVATAARQADAQALLTTEKDAVKMNAEAMYIKKQTLPCYALQVAMHIDDEANLMAIISRILERAAAVNQDYDTK